MEKQLDPEIKKILDNEAVATRKLSELAKNVKSWEKYRSDQRTLIRKALDGATIGKIGDVVTDEPKDQFSGKKFEAEYPALYEEYLRVRAVQELDVESLVADHPEIAAKFQVRTFLNKAA